MKTFKVFFDYEEEDAIEVMASSSDDAIWQVAKLMSVEHHWSDEEVREALGAMMAEEVLDTSGPEL